MEQGLLPVLVELISGMGSSVTLHSIRTVHMM
jgi:hypothetical protein